jgi:hypothetical protein
MSDGTILEKSDVRFQPSPNCSWEDPNGRRHSYGWKVHGKIKAGVTPEKFAEVYAANTKSGKPSPWTVTAGNRPAPVIISQARIMAAVKRDDMTGFCTECGSEQGGVEPDANSYRCEGCGAMAVSGAENLLLEIA